eukprot:6998445-Prymnesium_polylepis.2
MVRDEVCDRGTVFRAVVRRCARAHVCRVGFGLLRSGSRRGSPGDATCALGHVARTRRSLFEMFPAALLAASAVAAPASAAAPAVGTGCPLLPGTE